MFEDYVDYQVAGCDELLKKVALHERPPWEARIRARIEASRLGLMKVPEWFVTELHLIDPRLRCRYEFEESCWFIEIAVDASRSWQPVVVWKDEHKQALPLDRRLLDALRTGDMWKFDSPAKYLQWKRLQAEAQKEKNERESAQRLTDAVEDMSPTQRERFLEVDTAIKTGETIIAHGDDLRFMERATEITEKRLAAEEAGA